MVTVCKLTRPGQGGGGPGPQTPVRSLRNVLFLTALLGSAFSSKSTMDARVWRWLCQLCPYLGYLLVPFCHIPVSGVSLSSSISYSLHSAALEMRGLIKEIQIC